MNRRIIVFLAIAMMLCGVVEAEHLTILTVNDTHSSIMPTQTGRGGLMRRRVLMDSVRNADANVIAVHAGDAVQGTVFFSMFKGEVEYSAIDSLGYDIIVMGNHEFDNGINDIAKYYSRINADKICANYDLTGTALEGLLQPYVIKHVGGKRIAFMGININPKGLIADKCLGGLQYHDATAVALNLSKYLKESGIADYVVMVSHIGHSSRQGVPSDVEIAKNSKYIDLIIGGHSHTLVDPKNLNPRSPHLVKNIDGKDVPICQVGGLGEYVGRIDFDTETGNSVFSYIPVTDRYDERAANNYPAMNAWLDPYVKEADKKMNTRIATSVKAMDGRTPSLGNWVCDAVVEIGRQLYGKEVEFALMNRGGIRQPMPKGDVTEGIIEGMLPFDNRLEVIRIKGEYLMRVFEALAGRGGDAVSSAVDVTFSRDGKVVSAKINGKKVELNKYYTLITIDYLANGGSRMGDLKNGEVLFVDTVPYGQHVVEYVKQLDAKGKKIQSTDKRRMRYAED
ncbi:MAG: bifunctional metallophosphatase/5'-nucleotidase [Muribaculaceae bacterium]